MWLVAFGLLADLTGTNACSSRWYYEYWGWYWTRVYRSPGSLVGSRACSNWRAVLAFSCISWILFFLSMLVVSESLVWFAAVILTVRQGIYVFATRGRSNERFETHHRR